jgi:diphosphate-dependent phosphofructokinase
MEIPSCLLLVDDETNPARRTRPHHLDNPESSITQPIPPTGLAPCLSASIAELMKAWIAAAQKGDIAGVTFRMYKSGYKGILTNDSFIVPPESYDSILPTLSQLGGSPIGNSRVKLTNVEDCIKNGWCNVGETPLEVAAQQLLSDQIHVLHTIGGDDTNTQAAQLSHYLLEAHGGQVLVIGMPKTVDNDVYPILQTFGAMTAAEQGSIFFSNVVSETSAVPRMLILHECMGRDSGYLTAQTAKLYREKYVANLPTTSCFPFVTPNTRDIHAIWIPELKLDIMAEAERLKKIMDTYGCVNVFFGEGTGVAEIVADMDPKDVPRDAFGHVALAKIKPGDYFSNRLAKLVNADKTLVQRSGYFARSAPANEFDQTLIGQCAVAGVASAIAGISGCMGQDEEAIDTPIAAIAFPRIKGHKPFDIKQEWFQQMLTDIGQTTTAAVPEPEPALV